MSPKEKLTLLLATVRDDLKPEDGAVGERGEKGDTGADGKDGIQGEKGTDGKDGIPGVDGKDGISGKDGKVGKTGPKGAKGAKGDTGPKGDDGKDAEPMETGDVVNITTPIIIENVQKAVASKTYGVHEMEDMQDATTNQVPIKQADGSWAPGTIDVDEIEAWGEITGTLSDQTDLQDELTRIEGEIDPNFVGEDQAGSPSATGTKSIAIGFDGDAPNAAEMNVGFGGRMSSGKMHLSRVINAASSGMHDLLPDESDVNSFIYVEDKQVLILDIDIIAVSIFAFGPPSLLLENYKLSVTKDWLDDMKISDMKYTEISRLTFATDWESNVYVDDADGSLRVEFDHKGHSYGVRVGAAINYTRMDFSA